MTTIIQYRNNWENDVYTTEDGKTITDLKTVRIKEKEYQVTRKTKTVSYNDMGHTYNATSWHYYIQEEVFGSMYNFDLNTVANKVRVYAIDYQTDEQ